MSRYGGDPRYSDTQLPYREPTRTRWDADRFGRETENRYRGPPVAERDPIPPPSQRRAPAFEEKRYYEEDRYGPRGQVRERKFYEEEEYYGDPRAAGGAMVPFRPKQPNVNRPIAPPAPRPGLLRRQSSLDTFDRKPVRRFAEFDEYRGPPPGVGPPARYARERVYDDIKVQERDDHGEGYREYKEREWITRRRRDSSHSRERERSTTGTREEVREEVVEEVQEEKPFPRRGKTRMPRRIVNIRVLMDLGYPFHEEGEMIIIEKALGKENIDEVVEMSRNYTEREEVRIVRSRSVAPSAPEIIQETRITEEIRTVPLDEAPRSVREWDALSVRSPSPGAKSHKSSKTSKSHKSTKSRKSAATSRSRSRRPSKSRKSSVSSSSSSSSSESGEVIERRIIETTDAEDSNSVHIGPLALVVDRRKSTSKSDRDLKEEIRRLEEERRALRRERREGTEIVKVERIRERSPSRSRGEIIVRDGKEEVEVRKDRRGPAPPTPGMIKAMMATLT